MPLHFQLPLYLRLNGIDFKTSVEGAVNLPAICKSKIGGQFIVHWGLIIIK